MRWWVGILGNHFCCSSNCHFLLRSLCLGIFPISLILEFSLSAVVDDRPNFVVILADDLGFSDIGCYGGEIQTPNIDRLAANGLRFTQFYNCARCNPTRASLLTGLYPHKAGVGGPLIGFPPAYAGYLGKDTVTMAELLGQAGYSTFMSGKWHLGDKRPHWPVDRGFDRYFGLLDGAGSFWELLPGNKMAMDDQPWEPDPEDESYYLTDAITDRGIEFIETNSKGSSPFFLYLAYTAPHWPLHAWPEDIAKYRGRYLIGWDELRQRRHRRQLIQGIVDEKWKLSSRESGIPAWDQLEQSEKDIQDLRMAVYAAMIDRMDQGIGRVLDVIARHGQLENTLVLFLSDNGGCHVMVNRGEPGVPPGPRGGFWGYDKHWANASNTPFRRYKQFTHEGGITTPLICSWPSGIKQPGRMVRQQGHVIDLLPTFLDLAGIVYPASFSGQSALPLDGKSLAPYFEGDEKPIHDILYWEHNGSRAVREGKWKLVSAVDQPWELYDLENDRTELNNLIHARPQKARRLQRLYEDWAKQAGVISIQEQRERRAQRRQQ